MGNQTKQILDPDKTNPQALRRVCLSRLGDPRPEVTDIDAMQFCLVPGGPFWLGEEKEAHLVEFLNFDNWLGRYPVTHAQYMTFVAEDGYAQEKWWAEAIAADVWKDGAHTAYGDRRKQPYDYGRQLQLANLPVVGVSWYEAQAFTRWLTARWQGHGWLPAGWQATLPSEAEWENVARGGLEIPKMPQVTPVANMTDTNNMARQPNLEPRRVYTWQEGGLPPELANYGESEINQTSSGGAFRQATCVVGCEEMLGNVLEWTPSLDKAYPYDPKDGREVLQRGRTDWTVLRGGAWTGSEEYVRCGARLGINPGLGYGFRVVVSPFFDSAL